MGFFVFFPSPFLRLILRTGLRERAGFEICTVQHSTAEEPNALGRSPAASVCQDVGHGKNEKRGKKKKKKKKKKKRKKRRERPNVIMSYDS